MAWSVVFALLGALLFSMLIATVLASILFRRGAREWHNPVMAFLTDRYRNGVRRAIRWRWVTLAIPALLLFSSFYLPCAALLASELFPPLAPGPFFALR